MSPENVRRLRGACSQAWRRLDDPSSPLSFGIRCDDGWFDLLLTLSVLIAIELKSRPEEDFEFVEVKEKNGHLMVRHQGSQNDDIYKFVDFSCEEADKVCEQCGNKDQVAVRKWLGFKKTICEGCSCLCT